MKNDTQKETRRHDRTALLEDLERAQLRLAFHEMDEQLADTAERTLADNPDMRGQASAGESGVMRQIDRRLHAVEQRNARNALLPVLRVAACALVVLVIGFALGDGVHFTWFQGRQTEDDQVYLLEGKSLDVGPQADASNENAELEIYRLYTYEDVCDLLGFAPPLPDWAPEGWQLYEYYLSRIHGKITINAAYLQDGDPHFLHYQVTYIADMETYLNGIFQDGAGTWTTLPDGRPVYMTTNAGNSVIVCTIGQVVFHLGGRVSHEDLLHMLQSGLERAGM